MTEQGGLDMPASRNNWVKFDAEPNADHVQKSDVPGGTTLAGSPSEPGDVTVHTSNLDNLSYALKRRKMDSGTDSDTDWANSPLARKVISSPLLKHKNHNSKTEFTRTSSTERNNSFVDSSYGSLKFSPEYSGLTGETNLGDNDFFGDNDFAGHWNSEKNDTSENGNKLHSESNSSLDSVTSSDGYASSQMQRVSGNVFDVDFNSNESRIEHLTLHRLPGEKLGMILGVEGGKHENETVKSVIVRSVTTCGAAERATGGSRGVGVGDRILEINGLNLHTLSHSECVTVFKEMPLQVLMTIQRARQSKRKTYELDNGDVSTDSIMNSAPRGFTLHDIYVQKLLAEPLGLSIVPSYGTTKNFYQVKRLLQSGPSAKCGQLQPGDRILAYNNRSLRNIAQSECLSILRQPCEHVSLRVLRPTNKGKRLQITVTKSGSKEIAGYTSDLESASENTDTETDSSQVTSCSEDDDQRLSSSSEHGQDSLSLPVADVFGKHQFKLAYTEPSLESYDTENQFLRQDFQPFHPHGVIMSQNMEDLVSGNSEKEPGVMQMSSSDLDFLSSLDNLKSDEQNFFKAMSGDSIIHTSSETNESDLLLDFSDSTVTVQADKGANLYQTSNSQVPPPTEFADIPGIETYGKVSQNGYADLWEQGFGETNFISESDNDVPVTNIDDLLDEPGLASQVSADGNGPADPLLDFDTLHANRPTQSPPDILLQGSAIDSKQGQASESLLEVPLLVTHSEPEMEQIFTGHSVGVADKSEDGSISPFSSHSGSTVIQRTGSAFEEVEVSSAPATDLVGEPYDFVDQEVPHITTVKVEAGLPDLNEQSEDKDLTQKKHVSRVLVNPDEPLETEVKQSATDIVHRSNVSSVDDNAGSGVVSICLDSSDNESTKPVRNDACLVEEIVIQSMDYQDNQSSPSNSEFMEETITPTTVSRDVEISLDGAQLVPRVDRLPGDKTVLPDLVDSLVNVCKADDKKAVKRGMADISKSAEEELIVPSVKKSVNAEPLNVIQKGKETSNVTDPDEIVPIKVPRRSQTDSPTFENDIADGKSKDSLPDFVDSLVKHMDTTEKNFTRNLTSTSTSAVVQEDNITPCVVSRETECTPGFRGSPQARCDQADHVLTAEGSSADSHPEETIVPTTAPRRYPEPEMTASQEDFEKERRKNLPEFVDTLVTNLESSEKKHLESLATESNQDLVQEDEIVAVKKGENFSVPAQGTVQSENDFQVGLEVHSDIIPVSAPRRSPEINEEVTKVDKSTILPVLVDNLVTDLIKSDVSKEQEDTSETVLEATIVPVRKEEQQAEKKSTEHLHESIVPVQAPQRHAQTEDHANLSNQEHLKTESFPHIVNSLVQNLDHFEKKTKPVSDERTMVIEETILPTSKTPNNSTPNCESSKNFHTDDIVIEHSQTSEKVNVSEEILPKDFNSIPNTESVKTFHTNEIVTEHRQVSEHVNMSEEIQSKDSPPLPKSVPPNFNPLELESPVSPSSDILDVSADSVKSQSLSEDTPDSPADKMNDISKDSFSLPTALSPLPDTPSPRRLPSIKAFTAKGFTPVKLNSLGSSPAIKTVSLDRRVTTKLSSMSTSPLTGLNLQTSSQPQIKLAAVQSRSDSGPFQIDLLKGILGLGVKVSRGMDGSFKVSEIQRGSAAEKNGNIRIGDFVLSINGTEVTDLADAKVQQIMRLLPRGLVKLVLSTKPISKELSNEESTRLHPEPPVAKSGVTQPLKAMEVPSKASQQFTSRITNTSVESKNGRLSPTVMSVMAATYGEVVTEKDGVNNLNLNPAKAVDPGGKLNETEQPVTVDDTVDLSTTDKAADNRSETSEPSSLSGDSLLDSAESYASVHIHGKGDSFDKLDRTGNTIDLDYRQKTDDTDSAICVSPSNSIPVGDIRDINSDMDKTDQRSIKDHIETAPTEQKKAVPPPVKPRTKRVMSTESDGEILRMKKVEEWQLAKETSSEEAVAVTAYPVVVRPSPTPSPRLPRTTMSSKVGTPVSPRDRTNIESSETVLTRRTSDDASKKKIEPLDILDPSFRPSNVAKQFGTVKSPMSRKMSGLIDKFQHGDEPDSPGSQSESSTSPRVSVHSASPSTEARKPFAFPVHEEVKTQEQNVPKSPPKVAPKPKRRTSENIYQPIQQDKETLGIDHAHPYSNQKDTNTSKTEVSKEIDEPVVLRNRPNPSRREVRSERGSSSFVLSAARAQSQRPQSAEFKLNTRPRSVETVFSTRSLVASSASTRLKGLQIPSKAGDKTEEKTQQPLSTLQVNPSKLAPALRPRSGPAAFTRTQPKIHKVSPRLNLAPIKLNGNTDKSPEVSSSGNQEISIKEEIQEPPRGRVSSDSFVDTRDTGIYSASRVEFSEVETKPGIEPSVSATIVKESFIENQQNVQEKVPVNFKEREMEKEFSSAIVSESINKEQVEVSLVGKSEPSDVCTTNNGLNKENDSLNKEVPSETIDGLKVNANNQLQESVKSENLNESSEVDESLQQECPVLEKFAEDMSSNVIGVSLTTASDLIVGERAAQSQEPSTYCSTETDARDDETTKSEMNVVGSAIESQTGGDHYVVKPDDIVMDQQASTSVSLVESNNSFSITKEETSAPAEVTQAKSEDSDENKSETTAKLPASNISPKAVAMEQKMPATSDISSEVMSHTVEETEAPKTLSLSTNMEQEEDCPPELPNSPPPPLPLSTPPDFTVSVSTEIETFPTPVRQVEAPLTPPLNSSLPLALKRHQAAKLSTTKPLSGTSDIQITAESSPPDVTSTDNQLEVKSSLEFNPSENSTSTPSRDRQELIESQGPSPDATSPLIASTDVLQPDNSSKITQPVFDDTPSPRPVNGSTEHLKETSGAHEEDLSASAAVQTSSPTQQECDLSSSTHPANLSTLSATSRRKWTFVSNKSDQSLLSASPNTSISLDHSETSLLPPEELASLLEKANETLDETDKKEEEEIMVVLLHKDLGEKVGLSFKNGTGQEMLVSDVDNKSTAGKDGRILVDDQLLSINGKPMNEKSPHDARVMLRMSKEQVVLVLARSPCPRTQKPAEQSSLSEPSARRRLRSSEAMDKSSVNSSLENIQSALSENGTSTRRSPRSSVSPDKTSSPLPSPTALAAPHDPTNMQKLMVTMTKGVTGLGFCLEGGKSSPLGDRPILIKRLFKGGAADKCGLLQEKDEIVEVNGKSFEGLRHYEAWNYLKFLPDGEVKLIIRR